MIISDQLLGEMKCHFEEEYPREGCGVLAVISGTLNWLPIPNVSESEDAFVLDSSEYLNIKNSSDIVAIVHSHPNSTPEPSLSDINHCNALGIPYYIYSYPDMLSFILTPSTNTTSLFGREYKFGVQDCFEAMRDCYSCKFGIKLPQREPFEDDWWKRGLDYFNEDYINSWGFTKIDFNEAKPGSLLVFSIGAKVNNHCGVYLGNNVFYHHAVNRLSCREQLDSIWAKGLTEVYNYVA